MVLTALGESFHWGMLVYQAVYFLVKSCEKPVCVIVRRITPFYFLQFREKPVSIETGVVTVFFPLFRVVQWIRMSCHNTDLGEVVRGVGYDVATYEAVF